jgi:hypothetical protein
MGKGGRGTRTANDDRSDSMNPTSPAFPRWEENRGNQLNPERRTYRKSRDEKSDDESWE